MASSVVQRQKQQYHRHQHQHGQQQVCSPRSSRQHSPMPHTKTSNLPSCRPARPLSRSRWGLHCSACLAQCLPAQGRLRLRRCPSATIHRRHTSLKLVLLPHPLASHHSSAALASRLGPQLRQWHHQQTRCSCRVTIAQSALWSMMEASQRTQARPPPRQHITHSIARMLRSLTLLVLRPLLPQLQASSPLLTTPLLLALRTHLLLLF